MPLIPFYENLSHYRWLSVVEFMLSEVEVAKTPPQIFDRLSSYSGNVPFDSAQGTSLGLGSTLLLKPNS